MTDTPQRKFPGWMRIVAICAAGIGAVIILAGVVLVILVHQRAFLLAYFEASAHRHLRIDGPFSVQLFTRHPGLVAERVTIYNPPWTAQGSTAQIARIGLRYDLPFIERSFGLHALEFDGAVLHLNRDELGRSNWQWRPPGDQGGRGVPAIRSLTMRNARVELIDLPRHLHFDGTVDAREIAGPALRIDAAGQLNGRTAHISINGESLRGVGRETAYRFDLTADSSGTRLSVKGSLPQPFDFRQLDATFAADGEDLRDLFFLTGVSLPDTGTFKFTGATQRRGRQIDFTDLVVNSGPSDVRGSISIHTEKGHSHVGLQLRSKLLRWSDLGRRAAGRAPNQPRTLFLPVTPFHFNGLRKSDMTIGYQAAELDVGRVRLHDFEARGAAVDGVLELPQLRGKLGGGTLLSELRIDATGAAPGIDLDVRARDLDLQDLARPGVQAPLAGLAQAHLNLRGHGNSIHEVAAAASGSATVVLPHGSARASFAELAGLDLRGLGLLAAKSNEQTAVRCGIASFGFHEGRVTAQSLLLDTDQVLISGGGTLQLDSETLDLTLRGEAKKPRLRLRAPVLIHGTLLHPDFGTKAGAPAGQAGAAVALGALLTPLAAVLAFVDPGLAKDADCGALLAQGRAQGVPTPQR